MRTRYWLIAATSLLKLASLFLHFYKLWRSLLPDIALYCLHTHTHILNIYTQKYFTAKMATLISDQTFTEKPEGSETPIQVVGGCGTHSYFKNSFYQVYFLALHLFFLSEAWQYQKLFIIIIWITLRASWIYKETYRSLF